MITRKEIILSSILFLLAMIEFVYYFFPIGFILDIYYTVYEHYTINNLIFGIIFLIRISFSIIILIVSGLCILKYKKIAIIFSPIIFWLLDFSFLIFGSTKLPAYL